MRKPLVFMITALLLSGCMANWSSHKTGARWSGDLPGSPANNAPANTTSNAASGDAFGQPHGF